MKKCELEARDSHGPENLSLRLEGGKSSSLSNYYGEGMLTMSMMVGGKNDLAGGEKKFCESLRIGVLQYLTGLRNYALKAKLDDDF